MIIEWIIVGVFIFIGLLFLRFEHNTRKVKILIIIIIGFMLYFSVVGLFTSEKVDLTSPRGVVNAVYVYFGWIGQTAGKLWDIGVDTSHLVGNAIKLNNTQEETPKR